MLGWCISVKIISKSNQTFGFVQLQFVKYPYYFDLVTIIIFLDKSAFKQCFII